MARAIPDRWKDYKPVGQKIEGTRFIAFKVPLKEHVSNNVEMDLRLDSNILLKIIPNLGLIIDLTNTNRYYDPQVFQKEGVKHIKLMVPGHDTPSKELVDKFNTIVREFMANNTDNEKLIGVHCTHGVNRTGFLICNYMISQMTMEPNEALDRFSNARGHKIERNNYIDALHKLLETGVQVEPKPNVHPDMRRERNEEHVSNYSRQQNNRRQHESSRERNGGEEPARKYYRTQNNRREPNDLRKKPRELIDYSDMRREWHDHHARNRREKSRSPPPYYANNNRRNDLYTYRRPAYNIDERSYYLPPPPATIQAAPCEGLLRDPSTQPQQASRLRLDYHKARPTTGKQRNRYVQSSNRSHYI